MSLPAGPFRAVAFDLDGTLIDSAPDLARAANGMLSAMGQRVLSEDRVAAAIGDGVDTLVLRALTESTGAEPDAAALAEAGTIFRELYLRDVFHASRVYPGVREGLEALARRGLPLGCITNKVSHFTNALLERAGLAPWLDFVECANAPEQRKPAPFLLLKACGDLRIAPHELLYVGDSALDVAAARAAGCPVAMVPYGYNRGRPATECGADAVVTSIAVLAEMHSIFAVGGVGSRGLPPQPAPG